MKKKHYNFQARVSENNVPEEDFKFFEEQLSKGISKTTLAHEALSALRRLKQGKLVDLTELKEIYGNIEKPKPKREVVKVDKYETKDDSNKFEDKILSMSDKF